VDFKRIKKDDCELLFIWDKLQELIDNGQIKNIIDGKPVYMGRDYAATEKAIIDIIEKRNLIIRNHKKTRGLFT
jgi:RNase H-fold protein (predicted Holliday junction resolvase)